MFENLANWYIRTPSHPGKWRLERLLFKLMNGHFMKSVYGPELRVRAGDATNRFCITGALAKDYRDVYEEVRRLGPGDCFIDIGANCGLFTLTASQHVGRKGMVIAFEPSLPVFSDLIANIRRNGCQPVLPMAAAISEGTGVASFDSGSAGHTGVAHLSDTGATSVVTLNGSDLLHLLDPLLVGRPTLIKIDVEGHEAQVIRSIRPLIARAEVKRVVVEIDPENLRRSGSTAEEVYGIFAEAGFKPTRGIGAETHFNEVFVKE